MEPHKERQHGPTNGSGNPESPVIYVNFGLKWRHIVVSITAIITAMGSMATAGWLVLPAKQSDMTKVERGLTEVRGAIEELGQQNKEIILVMRELQVSVDTRRAAPAPAPIRIATRKPKPAPAQTAEERPKNIFGF